MTTNQKRLLTIAATAFAAYSVGTYILGLRGPLDAFGLAAGTESNTLEFGGRTRTYLVHRPMNGGRTPFQIGPVRTDTPVSSTVAFWVKRDGCSATPKHEETSQLRIDTYSGCKDGAGVTLYTIRGGHHMWPGTRLSHNDVPAIDIMWSFFATHPKP